MADFKGSQNLEMDRPRQISPYAIVLYCHESLTEHEEAALKLRFHEWKCRLTSEIELENGPDGEIRLSSPTPDRPERRRETHHQTALTRNRNRAAVVDRTATPRNNHTKRKLSPKSELQSERDSKRRHMDESSSRSTHEVEAKPLKVKPLKADPSKIQPTRVEMKDAEVQVKMSMIISLQKKALNLSASTQTPDLDKEDSYEAMLLRGGPLIKPAAAPPTTTTPTEADMKQKNPVFLRLYLNKKHRPRHYASLSSRFREMVNNSEDDLALGKQLKDFPVSTSLRFPPIY